VAIPTGIISAGFVEQYSRITRISDYASEEDLRFLTLRLADRDPWVGREIRELDLPESVLIAAVQRGSRPVLPRGRVVLRAGDELILGAKSVAGGENIALKEVTLRGAHPWIGRALDDLDLPRGSLVVMVRRRSRTLFPDGDFVLREGDRVILCTPSALARGEEPYGIERSE
ncbi:MAG: potassium channel protein, partial [Oscillibacter sp.]|nr:potassium channel protein [Oscillibacter sp.]